MFSIRKIAQITQGRWHQGVPVNISEYCIDSRNLMFAGRTLFFALTGEHHDGHDFVRPLYEAGVRAFIVQEMQADFGELTEANFILVKDVLNAFQRLAAHHRRQSEAEVIGVTGSNGKTIVKEWLYQLLAPDFRVYRSPGSFNSQVGVPLSLLGIRPEEEMAIIEAGISQRGEMQRLQEMIRPDIGILTHLGEAHDENFSSREEKLAEKAKLFAGCRLIIGEAGEATAFLRRQYPEARFMLWSREAGEEVEVYTLSVSDTSREVEIRHRAQHFRLTLPFGDPASLENIMPAVCYLLFKGVAHEAIAQRVRRLTAIAMRMDIRGGIHNSILINDFYNSDPTSFRLAMQTLATQDPTRQRTVILSDFAGSELGQSEAYRQLSGILQENNISLFIGIGEKLSRHREAFQLPARFYASTEQFLKQESRNDFHDQVILIKGARRFRFEYIAGFLQKQSHGTLLEVDLDALVHNLNYFRERTPARIAVMVKASAYGAGILEIASLLQYHRVDYLMVAFADEGIELRAAGITLPIAVMNPEPEAFDNMITFQLEPSLHNRELLEEFEKALIKHGVNQFPVHIKLNTGMNRAGFDAEEMPALRRFFQSPRTLFPRSVFSHLAVSDEGEHDSFTLQQIQLFEQLSEEFRSQFDYPVWRHILNSGGIERFPQYHFDMVRLGIGLHGISVADAPLRPISSLKSYISAIREVAPGQSVGYGRKNYTTRPSRIAIVPIGYADGLNRRLSHQVGEAWVQGQRVPIIGNISMDSCTLDITGTTASIGDEVEFFGENIPVTEVAAKLGTIPYEVLCGISPRVKRIYFKE